MDLVTIFQQVLNGLSIGSVYAIFALGYTLIFSILGIINFAHGAIFTLGAYFREMLILATIVVIFLRYYLPYYFWPQLWYYFLGSRF